MSTPATPRTSMRTPTVSTSRILSIIAAMTMASSLFLFVTPVQAGEELLIQGETSQSVGVICPAWENRPNRIVDAYWASGGHYLELPGPGCTASWTVTLEQEMTLTIGSITATQGDSCIHWLTKVDNANGWYNWVADADCAPRTEVRPMLFDQPTLLTIAAGTHLITFIHNVVSGDDTFIPAGVDYLYFQPVYRLPSPANLRAAPGPDSGMISLAWDPPLGVAIDYYRLYRADESGGVGAVIADGVTSTSYVDTDLPAPSKWTYHVRAFRGTDLSDFGAPVTASPAFACHADVCVVIVPESKIADLFKPNATAAIDPILTVRAEEGTFRLTTPAGFVQRTILVAQANGQPSPGTLNQQIGGGVSTSYIKQNDVCVQETCSFSIGATVDPSLPKLGELWSGRFQHYEGGVQQSELVFAYPSFE